MNVIAIIQARVGSTRLPGKVLADLCGAPVLQRVITRTQRATMLTGVVVATSDLSQDGPIVELATHCGVPVFRGPERDVLARYVGAAREHPADAYVRITADCPLVDPGIIDRAVRSLRASNYDYATNSVQRTFPRGLDVEVCWSDVLFRCDRLFTSPAAREHVFWGLYAERPELFLVRHIKDDGNHADWNWSIDTQWDLDYVRHIWEDVDYKTLIERLERQPKVRM